MTFTHIVRPRYAEVDQQGVVFNGHWLTYFDDACTRFFEHLGYTPKEVFVEGGQFDFMVVKAVLDWKGSAGFDDEVRIRVVPSRLGNASFDLRYEASVDGRAACEGVVTYVSVGPGTKEARAIPDEVRAHLDRSMSEAAAAAG